MSTPVESMDYDLFDYRHFDETPLSLDEAIKESSKLRVQRPDQFHRIVPVDHALSGFRIESVPKEAVYVDFLGRWTHLVTKFIARRSSR